MLYACQVVSEVWNSTSELPASSRTMKVMWLSSPVSGRRRWARYTPDTAVPGTSHEAETDHSAQSYSSVAASLRHSGCGRSRTAPGTEVMNRAPFPPYQPVR